MVLEPANALDVIKRVRPVAQETLIDRRVFLPGNHPVHHDEVTHVVARRRLMALGALLRRRRRVQESADPPGIEPVTPRALRPEQATVRFSIAVTAGTIETRFFRLFRFGQL